MWVEFKELIQTKRNVVGKLPITIMIQQKEVVTQVVGSYIKHVMPQLLAGFKFTEKNRENNRELKHEKVLWENFSPLTQKHIFKFQLLSLTLTSE